MTRLFFFIRTHDISAFRFMRCHYAVLLHDITWHVLCTGGASCRRILLKTLC